MKKLFSFITILTLCLVFFASGCSKPTPPHVITEETVNSSIYKELGELYTYKNASAITSLNGFQVNDCSSRLALLENTSTNKHVIYDFTEHKVVLETTSSANVTYEYEFLFNVAIIEYSENISASTFTTTIYDITGKKVGEKTSSSKLPAEQYLDNFIKVGGDYYCVSYNDTISFGFNDEFKAMPELSTYVGYSSSKNVYIFMKGATIYAYDKAFNLLDYYVVPSYATLTAKPFIYDEGAFIIQYYYNVEYTSETFSFVSEDGKKMKLDTILYHVANDTRSTINCNYIFNENSMFSNVSTAKSNGLYVPSDIRGFVYNEFYEIENYKPALRQDAMIHINSSSTAKRDFGMVNSQSFEMLPVELPNELFYAKLVNGQYILVSTEGFAKDTLENLKCNQNYIVINNKLYDYSGNLVENVEEYNVYALLSHGVILEKDGVCSLLLNGTITQICTAPQITVFDELKYCNGDMLYQIKTSSGSGTSYNYYNGKGELITTTTKEYSPVFAQNSLETCVLKAVSSNEYLLIK